jgi:ABC-type branched-subunit amino acid transport system ATPase component
VTGEDTALLRTADVSVRYGGVIANDGVSIEVGRGEIVGLIGPNGAGKTTFVDAVTGYAQASGRVLLGGQPLEHLAPHRRRRAGLARTWQAGELFLDLTVAENLAVAVDRAGWGALARDVFRRAAVPAEVGRTMDLLGLGAVAGRRPGELSLGQQKMAGVARALMGGSQVVLLDEPAAGLDTRESAEFGDELRRIAASGTGLLLIDHDMALVLDVCDRVYVMDFGRVIACDEPGKVRRDPAVIAAYLGSEVAP